VPDADSEGPGQACTRRVVFDAQGPPEVMRVVETFVPEPGQDQVLASVAWAGVNFVDLLQRGGEYSVKLPMTPGMEGSGTVLRVGPGVTGVAAGDRVAWMGVPGSYTSHCVVPVQRLVPVPAAVGLDDAAAALVHGMTAHFLASDVVPLGASSTCLVHAAAGGVGGLLCQLAAARGACVIGGVSRPDKAQSALAAGARHVIDYGGGRFADRVAELTGGTGVDVVYDAVGRDVFAESLNCLRPRGTYVLYGQASGPVGPVDPQLLNARGSLFLTKASLGHYDTSREQLLRRSAQVFDLVAGGALKLRVHQKLDLRDAPAAHVALSSRETLGKILLRP
jgi:NADPH2:quinone reductase